MLFWSLSVSQVSHLSQVKSPVINNKRPALELSAVCKRALLSQLGSPWEGDLVVKTAGSPCGGVQGLPT